IHGDEMVYVLHALRKHFRGDPNVFIGSNMFLYYRKGDPRSCVAPDDFVAKGVPKVLPGGVDQQRRTYKLWQEGQAPCFVLEVTSSDTREKDEEKKTTYAELGISEYFQFDPLGDYLRPPLQGLRLVRGRYQPIPPNPDGSLLSRTLGVLFKAGQNRLTLTNAETGEAYLREEEADEAWRQETKARRQAEEAQRQAEEAQRQAEARALALEEELARLRRKLGEG
ncbi:MAG: Uma2 family endonuclease, partial [Acidimicrobiia bacterium]